jgi:hypothetical protein
MRQLKITKSITNRESQSLDKYLQEIGKEGFDQCGDGGGVGPEDQAGR